MNCQKLFDRNAGDRSRPPSSSPALARLCQCDVLSSDEEQRLFQRLTQARAGISRCAEAVAIRNRIVESNLRLVVSLARHYRAPQRSIEDLVSEAAVPLVRCVDRFDWRRGTRFSTYATRALKNHFARLCRQDRRRRLRFSQSAELGQISDPQGRCHAEERTIRAEDLRRIADRLARLPPRERGLVSQRFGLTGDRQPRTFRELGERHGLSKERVRVLTSQAISQLKGSLDEWPAA